LAVLNRDLATQGGDGPDSEEVLAVGDVAQSNPAARLSLPNRLSHLANLEKTSGWWLGSARGLLAHAELASHRE
jgi:hypothetical protein